MTKRDYFNKIKALLETETDIVEFCDHEIELLDKKKSNGKAKVNETMNAHIEIVYNALAEIGKATPSELISKADLTELKNELNIVSTQKVASYLNKLVDCGRVTKTMDKKKPYFEIAKD